MRWQKQSSKRRREVVLPLPLSLTMSARSALKLAPPSAQRLPVAVVGSMNSSRTNMLPLRASLSARAAAPRKVTMTISLAFLSPVLVQAALEGRLPRGIGVTRLCDMPAEWSRQHEALGLSL